MLRITHLPQLAFTRTSKRLLKMDEQFHRVQNHVRQNVERIVDALNKELHLAEIVKLNIALDVDHTIGRPIKVTIVSLPAKETP